MQSSRVLSGLDATPAVSEQAPRRRPSGAPPPLPHHIHRTGLGWLIALVTVGGVAVITFRDGLHGVAIPLTVLDDTIVRLVGNVEAPGTFKAARMVTAVGSSWSTIQVLSTGIPIALLILRRWRHLLVTEIVIQVSQIAIRGVYEASARPRPFGVALRAGWGGWALPSQQMLASTGLIVAALYTLVPDGRWRNTGKWAVATVVPLVALSRLYLGIDAPTDIVVAVLIGVAIPVIAFRTFLPNEFFPVTYKK